MNKKLLISILVPPNGAYGPIVRCMSIAIEAQKAGFKVAVCCPYEYRSKIECFGFKYYNIPAPTVFGLPKLLSNSIVKINGYLNLTYFKKKTFGNIWIALFSQGFCSRRYLKKLYNHEKEAIDSFKPDVIFTELDVISFLLSKIRNTPIFTSYASVVNDGLNSFFYNLLEKKANRILINNGIAKHSLIDLLFGNKVLKLVPSIPHWDKSITQKEDVVFIGNLKKCDIFKSNYSFIPEKDIRYVFCYLGSGSIGFRKVKNVLPKFFDNQDKYQCIIVSNYISTPYKQGNIHFYPHLDTNAVLKHSDWVICHGGHNIIVESITNEIPLILFPGVIFERVYNTKNVVSSKCGIHGTFNDFNESWFSEMFKKRNDLIPNIKKVSNEFKTIGTKTSYMNKILDSLENYDKVYS